MVDPCLRLDPKGVDMGGLGDLPEFLWLARRLIELFAIVRLIGQPIAQVRDNQHGARRNAADDLRWPNLRQAHMSDTLPQKMTRCAKGNAGRPV